MYDNWWFFQGFLFSLLFLACTVACVVILAPLCADMPWVVSVRALAFSAGGKLLLPPLWGDESGGNLVVGRFGSLLVHVNDFFGAGGEDIFALYGEYPPVDVDTFFPEGGVVYVRNVVAVGV